MIAQFNADVSAEPFDVCVVGSGPAGLSLSLALERRGLSVMVLEAGGLNPAPAGATSHRTTRTHASTGLCMCQAFGGTSHWWGGRCVPLDERDFDMPASGAGCWPIGSQALTPYHDEACEFFGLPAKGFRAKPIFDLPPHVTFDTLERWTPAPNLGNVYRAHIEASRCIVLFTGVTVVGLVLSESRRSVEALRVVGPDGPGVLNARRIVLACGGLETTRLLLLAQKEHPDLFGGESGALGRYYMGHLSGRIASLALARPNDARQLDFFTDGGAFARRRLALSRERLQEEGLQNISFWTDNPPFYADAHRSGALSLVWLALRFAPLGRRILPEAIRLNHVGVADQPFAPHVRNVLLAPGRTARDVMRILHARFVARPRAPGFVVHTHDGVYDLHYHAEQSANAQSRVQLSSRLDHRGVALLDVDLRFKQCDARSVVAAHGVLAEALEESGWSRLAFVAPEHEREASVLAQARDGFHQIGTTRMGADPTRSVVDDHCRAHGLDNLFVASSSVFPTSGQANPTFTAVLLALRLAARLSATRHQASSAILSASSSA